MVFTPVQSRGRPQFSFEPMSGGSAPGRTRGEAAARTLRIALAGGGTGGHIVPGLHLLSTDRARRSVADVLWFQTGRAVEARVLAGAEERLAPARLERVTLTLEPDGGGAPGLARLGLCTAPAVLKARAALLAHRSQVLVGLGGFTSLPAALAARSLGIPIALLEVNAHCGRATRWLAPLARRVLHSWRSTLPKSTDGARSGSGRHLRIGPPLAPEFTAGTPDSVAQAEARQALGFSREAPLLAVLGGSQGAGGINRFVAEFAPFWTLNGLSVLHQVGPGRWGEAAPAGPGYRAVEYVGDVAEVLRGSTLVLCRGGASTLAEVGALRRPAWVVPYPHHADRHQETNARELGLGALIVDERKLSLDHAREVLRLCGPSGAGERSRMTFALEGVVPLDGAQRMFDEIALLANQHTSRFQSPVAGS